MHKSNGTPVTSSAPQSQWIDMTADTARHMLRGDAKLVAHYDALAAKASALDALVEAVTLATESIGVTATLDADAYQNAPGVDRAWESRITAFSEAEDALRAALTAAKAAQVSK